MYFTYNNLTIYYETYGNKKKSIIILPGWGDNRKTFYYMINFLKEYFTVYILDYPGFGNSLFPDTDLTIYDYSDLVYEWIKSLDIKDPILIGHSFGGRIITVLLGYYHYLFTSVIYLNSAGILPKKKFILRFKTFIYKALKKLKIFIPKKYKNKYLSFLFRKFASNDYSAIPDNMKRTFQNVVSEDLQPYLKEIESKVLIIWGNNDDITPVRDAYIMHKYIKDSELIVLDKATHFSYLDYPMLINNIIYEQIKEDT